MSQEINNQAAYSYVTTTASVLAFAGKGVLHTVAQGQNDALPTAGSVTIYDNASTNAGRVLYTTYWPAAAFKPSSVTLDIEVSNGVYIYFDTTGDVSLTVTFKEES